MNRRAKFIHDEAMNLADEADAARREGEFATAWIKYEKAADLETQAWALSPLGSRTATILEASATALLENARRLEKRR